MVQGLGLTTTELMLARASAIKYAGKRDKPARLIDLMLRFGMDFLTITPLSTEHLQNLRETSSVHWARMLASLPGTNEEFESPSSSDESELSVSWDPTEESETMPVRGTEEHTVAVTKHVENLVQCYVSRQTEVIHELEVIRETGQSAAGRRRSGSSGMTRRRKQATPSRRALPTASQATQSQATTRSQPQRERQERQETVPVVARPSQRELLLALPGITATRIPKEDSLARLAQFLRNNQPCDPPQVSRQPC